MNDFLISCIYEYLNRETTAVENTLMLLHRKINLRKADTVDIIDLIETRVRYETICELQESLIRIISWGRIFDKPN